MTGTKKLTLGPVDLFAPKKCRISSFWDFGEIEFGIEVYIEFQTKSNLIVLFRVRRTIKTKDIVFCTFVVGSRIFEKND